MTRYYHYDSKGRVIQLNEYWSDGRTHRVSTKYSFTGDVLATKETVVTPPASGSGPDQENSLATFYTRDQRGRILSSSRTLDGTDELETVNYYYDDLGRLVSKSAGIPLSPAVETTLSYDLHGWTTGIGVTMDDGEGSQQTVFSEAIRYASPAKDLSAGRYDGNIAETAFSHRIGSSTLQTHTWSYAYDGLKRLTGANHYIGGQSVASLTDTEKNFGYDLNGNITALKRYGTSGLANDLSFTHTGNRMTSLVDANATGNDAGTKVFAYDVNGNLTADGRKGLEMSWNLLNLADSAAMHGSSLTYAWLSDGTKVSAKADDGSGNGLQKRYVGSFVFTSDSGSSSDPATEVESIAWDEGRITYDGSSLRDCWFAGHHLGNVRTVIDITGDLDAPQILEQSNYLPFGTKIQNAAHASWTNNRWRYAAKEEQRFGSLDLSLLDFGARMYDPFAARWTAVDPLANSFSSICPFSYCGGDPINHLDPNGNWVWVAVGVAIEYGSQVYNNFQNGKTGYDAWVGDVNFVRVGLSAINPGKKLFLAKTILLEGAKAAVTYTPNDGISVNKDVGEVAKETVKNTAINTTVGKILEASSPQAVEATRKDASEAAKNASSASHKASRCPTSAKATKALSEAEGKASASGAQAAGTKALNNTIGANPEATKAAINYINTSLENETNNQR